MILVTGGTEYIGSICVEQLFTLAEQVIVIDNLMEGKREPRKSIKRSGCLIPLNECRKHNLPDST